MSDWRTRSEALRAARLTAVEREAEDIWTLYFRDEICSGASPGQFVMAWAPGSEEVPMSLSTIGRGGVSSVTVRSVGEASVALCGMRAGERIGVRGPFGHGYDIVGGSPLLVAGGTGAASLAPLAEAMVGRGLRPAFVLGARSRDRLLFRDRLEEQLGGRLYSSTEDGTLGFRGRASDLASRLMDETQPSAVYTCGPEVMMLSVFDAAEGRGIPFQASLERLIKCAVGLCGSCAIGPYLVCSDGPVFGSEQLRSMRDEFGRARMDASGLIVPLG